MALPGVSVNESTVMIVALLVMVLGALWYSPLLFGRLWMRLSEVNGKKVVARKQRRMIMSYVVAFIGTLLMLYVIAHLILYLEVSSIGDSFQLAFWLWVGFIAPTHLGIVLWEGKPLTLYLINTGYYLAALLIASPILAAW